MEYLSTEAARKSKEPTDKLRETKKELADLTKKTKKKGGGGCRGAPLGGCALSSGTCTR